MPKGKYKKPKRPRCTHPFRSRPFTPPKNTKKPRFDWSAVRDVLETLLVLAWVVFLFGLFVIAPPAIGKIYGPGWGVLTALLGHPIWATFGIRPMPGLIDGCICLAGYSVIHCAVLLATLQFLKSLFR